MIDSSHYFNTMRAIESLFVFNEARVRGVTWEVPNGSISWPPRGRNTWRYRSDRTRNRARSDLYQIRLGVSCTGTWADYSWKASSSGRIWSTFGTSYSPSCPIRTASIDRKSTSPAALGDSTKPCPNKYLFIQDSSSFTGALYRILQVSNNLYSIILWGSEQSRIMRKSCQESTKFSFNQQDFYSIHEISLENRCQSRESWSWIDSWN